MANDNLEIARRVFRAFDPRPLKSSEQNLYVDLDLARGDTDLVGRLSKEILFSDRPTTQLVSGHNGSGKSTELARLQTLLQQQRYFVVYFEAGDEIDREDVDFLDILIAVVKQVLVQLHAQLNISLRPGYFRDRFQKLGELLTTEVELDKLDLDAGLTSLGISLKNSPSHRTQVRSLLETDTGTSVEDASKRGRTRRSNLARTGGTKSTVRCREPASPCCW